ncbi:hypothetical protein MXL54_11100 [Enterobacteriaceae bacterium G50]|nr:hypothetical protein [Enterobacteriaceae bacterium G50]
MRYAFLFLFIFTRIVFGSNANILDVNSAKNISVKVLLEDNDLLVVSVLDAGK